MERIEFITPGAIVYLFGDFNKVLFYDEIFAMNFTIIFIECVLRKS